MKLHHDLNLVELKSPRQKHVLARTVFVYELAKTYARGMIGLSGRPVSFFVRVFEVEARQA